MKKHSNDKSYAFNDIEQYESFITAIPGGMVITAADDDFTILFANQSYYDMVGYEKSEHIQTFQNVGVNTLHPDEMLVATTSARAQMAESGSFSVNAKLGHKSGTYIWVHFSGKLHVAPNGDTRIYIVLVDITDHQRTLERLEKEKAFSELISMFSEEYFFDCDLHSDTMRYSKNFSDLLGIDETLSDYKAAFQQLGLLTADQCAEPEFQILENILHEPEQELRFTQPNGEDIWYLCSCNVLKNGAGVPVHIVGKLVDITRHKMQIDELSDLAHRDQLTGLFNKTATENRIKEILKKRRLHDDCCALLIIDIDNFKNINDRLGHLYGDAVLTQLAEYLKTLFRSDDVVGRVGGDEFFIFLKNYGSMKVLRKKAKQICDAFHKTYSEGDAFVTISASIGIALCPEHDNHLDGLYKKADAALYEVKATGKNAFAFYNANITSTYQSTRTKIDTNTLLKSFKDNRIEYVFRLLYNSENPASSIQSILQLITESYDFSRGYIFEISADGQFTDNTFEWCTKEITAQIQNLQSLPIEVIASAHTAFLETGMFILKSVGALPDMEREVLEPQGIKSMFQFGIVDQGRLSGFIGFDDCISERIPTDAEIDEICTVCHVLATFLSKHRTQEQALRHHEAVEMVIDHMHQYIYVIDPDNHTLLYENRQMEHLMGSSSIGQRCHLAYCKSKHPCVNCPLTHETPLKGCPFVMQKNTNTTIYVQTEITRIKWTDNNEVFMFCGAEALYH